MPNRKVFPGLVALLAPMAAAAAAPQSQRGALAVSATVVPACEVAVRAGAERIASGPSPAERLATSTCTAGATPEVTVERAPHPRPASETMLGDGTLYVTLTY